MIIEQLIPNLNLEDLNNEFKGILEEGQDEKGGRKEIGWLKEIAGFANAKGGCLYVGVADKSHEILSLDHSTVDKVVLMFQRLVLAHLEPVPVYSIQELPIPATSPIRYIIKISVDKTKYPPVTLRFNGTASIYIRHYGKVSIATGEEIRSMIFASESISYDSMETNVPFKKEDFKTLFDFYAKQSEGKELSEKDLINIDFMTPSRHLKKGALLFADACQDEATLIECSQFKTLNKGGDEFYASKQIKGNLLKELMETIEFVKNHSASGFIKTENGRKELSSYPQRSLLEGIANALGHRNYFIYGGQIEVNLFPDRLEITSPGSFLGNRHLIRETNLSELLPLRRNKLICNVLSLCRIMDKKGSGFDKIEEDYKPYGDSFAPFANSDDESFTLVLPDLAHHDGLISNSDICQVKALASSGVKEENEILSFCYISAKSASEIAKHLGISSSTYFRKEILGKLLESENLLMVMGTYPTLYRTNPKRVTII